MHKVERKETIFSICQEYGITQEDLLALNPELKNGKLKKGMFIFIPYPKAASLQQRLLPQWFKHLLMKSCSSKARSLLSLCIPFRQL